MNEPPTKSGLNEEDEPPLLEDLGIEFDKIKDKFISIIT
jgi:hypothetical protein